MNAYRATSILAGLVLAFAGCAKLVMVFNDPFTDLKIGISIPIVISIITWEFLLFSVVAFRFAPSLEKFLLLFTFGIFLGVSVFRFVNGVASCNCFGTISFPTWAGSAASLFFVVMLLAVRNPNSGTFDDFKPADIVGLVIGDIVFGMSAYFGIASIQNGRWVGAVANNEELHNLVAESTNTAHFELVNRTEQPVRIVGMKSSCTCVMPAPGFFSPEPHPKTFGTVVVIPKHQGEFRQRVVVYVDHPLQSFVLLDLVGWAK